MTRRADCHECGWAYIEHPSRPHITAEKAAEGHYASARHVSVVGNARSRAPNEPDSDEEGAEQLTLALGEGKEIT